MTTNDLAEEIVEGTRQALRIGLQIRAMLASVANDPDSATVKEALHQLGSMLQIAQLAADAAKALVKKETPHDH